MSKLGNRIRQMRVKRCMTQQELARLVGLEKAAVSKYETGRITDIKSELTDKFAKALGTSSEYLLGFTDSCEQSCKSPFDQMLLEAYHDAPSTFQKAIRILLGLEIEA